jgi:hypothetical protein
VGSGDPCEVTPCQIKRATIGAKPSRTKPQVNARQWDEAGAG